MAIFSGNRGFDSARRSEDLQGLLDGGEIVGRDEDRYCLPCLVLLAIGMRGGPVTRHLRRLHDRFGTTADIPASKVAVKASMAPVGTGVSG